MHHFQALVAGTDLTEAAQMATGLVRLLLGLVEIKKAQLQQAGVVIEHHDQRAAPAEHDAGIFDAAIDQHAHAGCQAANAGQPGAVLIANRQMQQQIMHLMNADGIELLTKLDADATQAQQIVGIFIVLHNIYSPVALTTREPLINHARSEFSPEKP